MTGLIRRLRHPLQLYFRLLCAVTSTVPLGESIALKENNGEDMYVEGRMLTSRCKSDLSAVIETWETWEWTTRVCHIRFSPLLLR